ncbi:MAG TPA: Na+/H+ antiporter NhaA [Anaeromyxobacteraceae bacterium]|nr:Na+/H+ antiporter NhaA [Anaeromyxobacteraceae bacterium]
MTSDRARPLVPPVDVARDHVLGAPGAPITLVEYGSYSCPFCHAAHGVIADLRDRFGDRMRYVFRHLPLRGSDEAVTAAALAEYAGETAGKFWEAHDALMRRGPVFRPGELDAIGAELGLPPHDAAHSAATRAAAARVQEDTVSARQSGALVTPTFFINGRRFEGAWDEAELSEAMLGSLGHRLHAATLDFVRWGPSSGLMLLVASTIAIAIWNTSLGPAFSSWWHAPLGLLLGGGAFTMPLIDWVNHGLLTIFFLVVALEIKRELAVGRLASRRAATLPIVASIGGMIAPAILYLLVSPGPTDHGWGMTITTDTAFAVALVVLLGRRVPVDLRVFLTAAVIVDDLVGIAVVALFYSGALDPGFLVASVLVTGLMVALNRSGVYAALPYALLGVLLWACLHDAGVHATLAGVVLAVATPTRPPANLHALMAQAQTVIEAETRAGGEAVMRHGPSEPALRALDAIHDRIESPASKVLRSVEPWSSYVVLPVFALANAGVAWSAALMEGHGRLVTAIVLGLAVGKPLGILSFSWLVVRLGLAEKPSSYSWRQLCGAAAIAGIGFTMSLFIAERAFRSSEELGAAKIGVFAASLVAGTVGTLILWPRAEATEDTEPP